jgi:metallopeptidase MepB
MNKAAGRRYRYQVLEKGGSQDEMKTLTEFLGRECRWSKLGSCRAKS